MHCNAHHIAASDMFPDSTQPDLIMSAGFHDQQSQAVGRNGQLDQRYQGRHLVACGLEVSVQGSHALLRRLPGIPLGTLPL